MPSDPDSGPMTMSTSSCSTTLRAARIAESGLASVAPMITSTSRPPGLAAELVHGDLESADPVLAEHGVRSFERGQETDLQRLRGERGSCAAEREPEPEPRRADMTFPHDVFSSFVLLDVQPRLAAPAQPPRATYRRVYRVVPVR